MKIKWYGHSAFRLTSADGVAVIIDPYRVEAFGDEFTHAAIDDPADLVLISHGHDDHSGTSHIKGSYSEMKKEGTLDVKGVRVTAIPTFHDTSEGQERGRNLVFVINFPGEDLVVAHLGDLGHLLDRDAIERIGKVDVLMIPVGGFFTIDAKAATAIVEKIGPSITIPMHFKTEKVRFPITGVDEFIEGKKNVRRMDKSEVDVVKAELPEEPEIMVLRYAL